MQAAAGAALAAARAATALADGAAAARREYESAENSALAALGPVLGPVLGSLGAGSLRPGLLGLPLAALPAPHEFLRPLGWALGVLPGSGPAVVVDPVGVVAGDPGGPVTRRDDAPVGASGEEPGGVASGLLTGIDALYPAAGGQPGSLEVRRIEQPGGVTSWAVLIPGTQSVGLWGSSPMDSATNLQEYVGAPSAMAAAVVTAMGMAGVRRGEPVLLAGHSQGGLVAMRLAADPAVRRRYDVAAVLTAGTPAGHLPSPRGVSVLHLEHGGDVVPALDIAANPDVADRTTVRHPGSGPAPPASSGRAAGADGTDAAAGVGSGGPHAASSYVRTAALVDASDHPSVTAWREQASQVLGDSRASVTRSVYVAERLG